MATKPQFENLPAAPANIIEILIMDAQILQRYYGTMFAKTLNRDNAGKFNQCNELIDQLVKLR